MTLPSDAVPCVVAVDWSGGCNGRGVGGDQLLLVEACSRPCRCRICRGSGRYCGIDPPHLYPLRDSWLVLVWGKGLPGTRGDRRSGSRLFPHQKQSHQRGPSSLPHPVLVCWFCGRRSCGLVVGCTPHNGGRTPEQPGPAVGSLLPPQRCLGDNQARHWGARQRLGTQLRRGNELRLPDRVARLHFAVCNP